MSLNIQKIIYQTWKTKTLPEEIIRGIEYMMKLNPEFTHCLYNDEEMHSFIKNNYDTDIQKAYESLNIGAAKADLWRYLILFKYGGVYLDIDSLIINNLKNLIVDDNHAIISRERNPNKFVQWMLIYPPKHPILEICIKKCLWNIKKKSSNNILELTGPIPYTLSVIQHFKDSKIYYKKDDEINLSCSQTSVKMYSYDYENYALFSSQSKDKLYSKDNPHWREDSRELFI